MVSPRTPSYETQTSIPNTKSEFQKGRRDKKRKRNKGAERLFKDIMAENTPNLITINLHIQKAQQILSIINSEVHS